MGNTCSPDKSAKDRVIADTDKEVVKEATDKGTGETKQLTDILNSYQAEIEKLRAANKKLEEENDAKTLQAELEKMKEMLAAKDETLKEKESKIAEEENRIALLKLQSTLREQEVRVLKDNITATTIIEGKLEKFGKGGKSKAREKHVLITYKKGEKIESGFASGQLQLCWADDEKSTDMTRVHITKLIDGADAVKKSEYASRCFSLETQPGNKIIALAARDEEEMRRWYDTIKKYMDEIKEESIAMHETYTLQLDFEKRPLGFRVEEQFLVTEDGERKEALMVTKIQKDAEHLRRQGLTEGLVVIGCNGKDFRPLTYTEKLDIIKTSKYPISLDFEGFEYLKQGEATRAAHVRDVSMAVLYPELLAQLSQEDSIAREALTSHPLVANNKEFQEWVKRPDFKDLLKGLMSDPDKLRSFLMNNEI